MSPVDLRNGNVPSHYFKTVPFGLKIVKCRLLKFEKRLCHPVKFKGQGPHNDSTLTTYQCGEVYFSRTMCQGVCVNGVVVFVR